MIAHYDFIVYILNREKGQITRDFLNKRYNHKQ